MPRRLSFTITDEYDNRKVVHFLRGNAQLSARLIGSLKRIENGIMLNGNHIRTIDMLKKGDILTVTIPDEERSTEPVNIPLDVLFEDDDLIAVNKSPYLAMHPSHNHQGDTLANAMAWHLAGSGKSSTFRAVGRLDKGTSGVVICALNKYAAARLNGNIEKEYLAVVPGHFEGNGTIDIPIYRPDPMKTLRACSEEGESAVTHWQCLQCGHGMSLLKIQLETGRTHQIRAHFAHIGAPLVGDGMYGGIHAELGHQLLHCSSAEFTHPVTGERLKISAPMPYEMENFVQSMNNAQNDEYMEQK